MMTRVAAGKLDTVCGMKKKRSRKKTNPEKSSLNPHRNFTIHAACPTRLNIARSFSPQGGQATFLYKFRDITLSPADVSRYTCCRCEKLRHRLIIWIDL